MQANQRIFAIIFWFVVLGPLGALLYRLSLELYRDQKEIHGDYADSVRRLHYLLSWPVTRLSIVIFALVGNLVHTFDAWRDYEHDDENISLDEGLLRECGLAAIQYRQDDEISDGDWLDEAHGLINRGLLLWVTLIAFGTISGRLS